MNTKTMEPKIRVINTAVDQCLMDKKDLATFFKTTVEGINGRMRRRELPEESIVRFGKNIRFIRSVILKHYGLAEGRGDDAR